jgi:hypothetical protein
MDHDSIEVKLPLRLEPRRGQVFFQFLFMLLWTGFIVFWAVQFVPAFLGEHEVPLGQAFSAEHLILLIPLGMLLVGLYSLGRLLIQFIPGSNFVYVIVDKEGLRRRQFGTRQQIRWTDIRRISIIRRKAGKSTKRVLLVEGKDYKPVRDDESARYTAAPFTLDLGTFLPTFCNEDDAGKVSAWFNALLHQAREGTFPDRTRIPAPLVASAKAVREVGMEKAAARTTTRGRKSVIER